MCLVFTSRESRTETKAVFFGKLARAPDDDVLRGLTFILGKSKTCHKEVYPKNWTAEAYPGKDAATGSKPPGQQVLTLICRPSWQTRRFGSLCATDIFSAAKGRVLRSFISRSVPVIGEKPKNLKPAFVFFTKQQKGVRGLRNRRKQGLGQMAPNPVFVYA